MFEKLCVVLLLISCTALPSTFKNVPVNKQVDLSYILVKRILVLSSYETRVVASENRRSNLELAASKLDGTIIAPGSIFSFNDVVGQRTKEAGFKPAPEFLAGAKVDGIGGGVCQVSSTLYGAARQGWLTVLRRYSHSRPVTYTPAGTDAAVSYGVLDLVLQNPYNVPITIRMSLDKDILIASFEGLAPDFTVEHKYLAHLPKPFPIKEIISKFSGKRLLQSGREGIAGTSTWIQKRNGIEISRDVSVSEYKPIPEIWIVPKEE